MPTPPTTKLRKKSFFPCLALCAGLGLCVIPAHSQPPAARTEAIIDSVEQDWQNLRQSTGAKEFLDPQGTITAYQQFYEKEGYRSGQTAVEITGIIAQLYWQGLDNPQKALTIYDWGLQNFAHYRGITNLKNGRAVVAEMGNFAQTYSLPLAENNTPDLQNKPAVLKPVIIDPAKVLPPAVDGNTPAPPGDQNTNLAPVTLDNSKAAGISLIPANNPFAPVTVSPAANGEKATSKNLTVIPTTTTPSGVIPVNAGIQSTNKSTFSTVTVAKPDSQSTTKVLSPVAPDNKNVIPANAGIQSTSKSTFNPVTISGVNTQTASTALSPVTPNNQNAVSLTSKELSIITPPAPISSTSVSALVGIDPRQLALANAASVVRHGNLSIEDFFAQNKPTPQEALWMLSAPGVIISWDKDRPLRVALIGLIESQTPQLLQTPEKLPQATQMALADYYDSQRSPKGEAIYQTLIKEKTPDGAWWPKLWVMNALAEYYGVMGQFDKAAQAKLAIQDQTTAESWVGNTYVEAARFYTQAGETEKAQALYEKAEKSTYGWAAGVALIDYGRLLMSQNKYAEAIKVLSQPVQGSLADQIEPVKRMLVGEDYYQIGDLVKAKQNLQTAISNYHEMQSPLQGEGIQAMFLLAEKHMQVIDGWIKEPIQVEPKEMHITVNAKQLQSGPIITRLIVRTFRDAPLTLTADNKNITAYILSTDEWSDLFDASNDHQESEKEMIIKVTSLPPKGNSKVLLTISSTKYVGFQAQVIVYLEAVRM